MSSSPESVTSEAQPEVNEHSGSSAQEWKACTLTNRETCMIKFIEDITNKAEWWRKIRDPVISHKWKQEVLQIPWGEYLRHADFTEQMADFCLQELATKADLYEQTGLIPVMDYSACAIKSDKILSDQMRDELISAVEPLEKIPDEKKDWHPGSDGKVLDLVHPSLWPLVYGVTRVIESERITIDKCTALCGAGTIISCPKEGQIDGSSTRFQWLPCDIDLAGGGAKLDSYINNLHPDRHAQLYLIIEKLIEASLPAWDIVCRWKGGEFDANRFPTLEALKYECKAPDACGEYECEPSNRPGRPDDEEELEDEEFDENQELDKKWFSETHTAMLPDPKAIDDISTVGVSDVLGTGFFDNSSQIQVIVKLANIHLTPEKSTYGGGSWHVEGLPNEHIVATALYYYDTDNITDCQLGFRTQANREELENSLQYNEAQTEGIKEIYNMGLQSTVQEIGSVLTKKGRAVFFPNIYQHRVGSFELIDKARPGYRKILALFLIDPKVKIMSTAQVPPQQQDWWAEQVMDGRPLGTLPLEVQGIVQSHVEFPLSEKVAKELRLELMAERTSARMQNEDARQEVVWNFCEH